MAPRLKCDSRAPPIDSRPHCNGCADGRFAEAEAAWNDASGPGLRMQLNSAQYNERLGLFDDSA
jgi:hypothetical protein